METTPGIRGDDEPAPVLEVYEHLDPCTRSDVPAVEPLLTSHASGDSLVRVSDHGDDLLRVDAEVGVPSRDVRPARPVEDDLPGSFVVHISAILPLRLESRNLHFETCP